MTVLLSALPLWASFFLVVVAPTAAAMAGLVLVRRVYGLERLATNNEVAGFKFAVVGVTYAVLLGFAVIVVWEKFRDAEETVAQEASALVAIDRLSPGLDPAAGPAIRAKVGDYVRVVIADDWPAMANSRVDHRSGQALGDLYSEVLASNPQSRSQVVVMGEILNRLDAVTSARRTRLGLATGIVPGVLWAVLLSGALVTLSFTFFFGVQSVRSQILMTGMLAALIFMALYVAVEIDHPFTGPVSVTPEAMRTALEGMAGGP